MRRHTAEFDVNSSNPAIVNASLVAGLYPKVLALNTVKNELRTITNNQTVWMHPSSINFNRKLSDTGCSHFSYFTLMYEIALTLFVPCDIFEHNSVGIPRNCMLGKSVLLMTSQCFSFVGTVNSRYFLWSGTDENLYSTQQYVANCRYRHNWSQQSQIQHSAEIKCCLEVPSCESRQHPGITLPWPTAKPGSISLEGCLYDSVG